MEDMFTQTGCLLKNKLSYFYNMTNLISKLNLKDNFTKLKSGFIENFIDSTAINVVGFPACAAWERGLAGMSYELSLNARLNGLYLGYLGVASIISKGREFSRKLFKINDETKESLQYIHDTAYLAAFNLGFCPILYYASGSRDLKEIAMGTLGNIAFAFAAGGPIGYSIDIFNYLTGVKSCERSSYPNFIKNQSPKTKKVLSGLAVAGATALTAGVYAITPQYNISHILK